MKKINLVKYTKGELIPSSYSVLPLVFDSSTLSKVVEASWAPIPMKKLIQPFDSYYKNLLRNCNHKSKSFLVKNRNGFLDHYLVDLYKEINRKTSLPIEKNRESLENRFAEFLNARFFFVNLTVYGLLGKIEDLKNIRKEVKRANKRAKPFDKHLSRENREMYQFIWEINEEIKEKTGKYNYRKASFYAVEVDDENEGEEAKIRVYNRFKKYMTSHKIHSLSEYITHLESFNKQKI
jgi:hypothetical protein